MPKFEEFIKGFEESPKEELLDASGQFTTPYGRKASSDFLKENKIGDIYNLNSDEYDALAEKAMKKFGFNDLELAKNFLIGNDESDELAKKHVAEYQNKKKARKLVDLGEEPFGTHKFFYEKDGKFYSSGFSQEDEEVSPEDMAKAYDEYIAKNK